MRHSWLEIPSQEGCVIMIGFLSGVHGSRCGRRVPGRARRGVRGGQRALQRRPAPIGDQLTKLASQGLDLGCSTQPA